MGGAFVVLGVFIFVFVVMWPLAQGHVFCCRGGLIGSWNPRSAGFFKGRQIWEVPVWAFGFDYDDIITYDMIYIYIYHASA